MSVPVLSLAGHPGEIAADIDAALRKHGFFVIVDHGVRPAAIEDVVRTAAGFFDRPLVEKLRYVSTDPSYPYGYEPIQSEALGAAHGGVAVGDLKETFNIGPPARDTAGASAGSRVWPDSPDGFEAAWTAYYEAMEELAARLMELFAIALGLDRAFFDDKIDRHLGAVRALNYPPQPAPPVEGQVRAAAHTDYGTLTVLWTGAGSGGLEVQHRDGSWIGVPVIPEGFVVNIGDLMAMWTNNRWRSTPHRVINPDDAVAATERRRSVAFFHQPNADARIEVLPTCVGPDNPPVHEPTTAGEWLAARVADAHRH